MSEAFLQEAGFESQDDIYKSIDEANQRSFLMNEAPRFSVIQSLHSAGSPRDILTPAEQFRFDDDAVQYAAEIGRKTLAGNMSPLNNYGPSELSKQEKIEDAKSNIISFLQQHHIAPESVRILRPERDYTTPLSIVELDTVELSHDDTGLLRPEKAGDFMYTYDRESVLAARPADCPLVLVSAETPKGDVSVLLHLAWLGVAHGYIDQAKAALDGLSVDWETLRAVVSPGGQARSFQFKNFDKYNPSEQFADHKDMFIMNSMYDAEGVPVEASEDASKYDFAIELPGYVYKELIRSWGIDPYQVFLDTSDTTSAASGYSSNSRAYREYAVNGENTRDLVIATFNPAT